MYYVEMHFIWLHMRDALLFNVRIYIYGYTDMPKMIIEMFVTDETVFLSKTTTLYAYHGYSEGKIKFISSSSSSTPELDHAAHALYSVTEQELPPVCMK